MINKNFNSYDLFILKIFYNAGQNAEIILDYLAIAKLILLLPLTVFYVKYYRVIFCSFHSLILSYSHPEFWRNLSESALRSQKNGISSLSIPMNRNENPLQITSPSSP